MKRWRWRLLLALLALGAALAGWVAVETHLVLEETEVVAVLPGLEADLPEFEVVHLTDLHFRGRGLREERLLQAVARRPPDLLLITGDFIDRGRDFEGLADLVELGEYLDDLVQRCEGPALAITGNHDSHPLLPDVLAEAGVRLLRNESAVVPTPAGPLHVVGVDFFELSPEPLDREVDRFERLQWEGGGVLATRSERTNLYCHYVGEGSESLAAYRCSADVFMESAEAGIGLVVASRFPFGSDRFHRLRRYGGDDGSPAAAFHLAPHGADLGAVHSESAVAPRAGMWIHLELEVSRGQDGTRIRGRATERDSGAVLSDLAATDAGPRQVSAGTFGLWSMGPGLKVFDNVRVEELATGRVIYENGFEQDARGFDLGTDMPRMKLAFAGVPVDQPCIALVHRPGEAEGAGVHGADLVLAGDTHGGQVGIQWLGRLLFPDKVPDKYRAGSYRLEDGTPLYVSRGVGTSYLPIRWLCPPELTRVRFRKP